VDGSSFAVSDWEEFKNGSLWSAVLFEISERDKYIMELLRYGDPDGKWSDHEMRARLNELEYTESIPDVMIADIKMQMLRSTSKDEEEENKLEDL
jgi:hypothetical protein